MFTECSPRQTLAVVGVDSDPPLLRTGRGWAVAGEGGCLTGEGALQLGLGKWLGLCQTKGFPCRGI